MPNAPKPIDKEKTLAHARKSGDLESFIAEHEKDEPGDLDRLEQAIKRPASSQESGSKAPKASRPASSDD